MTEPFLGEVQILSFGFAPVGWALANGAMMQVRQYSALYSLFGTSFGGDGVTTFQLPNLVSRFACGSGQGPGLTPRQLGSPFGSLTETLSLDELPTHNHMLVDYTGADPGSQMSGTPTMASGMGYAASGNFTAFVAPGAAVQMSPTMVSPAGGNQPHPNVQPFLSLIYAVALTGNFPSFP